MRRHGFMHLAYIYIQLHMYVRIVTLVYILSCYTAAFITSSE